eukprot:TRINITY_DN3151_c0_g1_i1.p3 TRINITY_DN3151_c0_g1~~TRINITY_DN3151_c0_g1_i1.p3  ORF type:complete len:194 (+),score=52.88 TRINITY_DN3151_c0_g1_i1:1102-1683(+)
MGEAPRMENARSVEYVGCMRCDTCGCRASGPLAPSAAAAVPAEPLTAADAADLHRRADTLFHSKQFKAAQPMFRRLHVHAPRDWIAWMKLGACLTFSGDPAELADGELELRRLSELLPGSPRVYMLLGQNLSRQQRWADCVEAVQRGLQCHPQDDSPDYVIDGSATLASLFRSIDRSCRDFCRCCLDRSCGNC